MPFTSFFVIMITMKKGFTLVELLIVVVILVTLMTMVFRLGSVAGDSEKRAVTIQRVQMMENALSGYYAAFGMYPPVKVHGSRDIYTAVSENGSQSSSGQQNTSIWGWCDTNGNVTDWNAEYLAWRQVEQACRSQPVGCAFPFEQGMEDDIRDASAELQRQASESQKMPQALRAKAMAGFDQVRPEDVASNRDETDWNEIKLFRFGVMSYLLPRYLVMMNGDLRFFTQYAQWTGNNGESGPCDAMTGATMSWQEVRQNATSTQVRDYIKVANVPSQSVTARWMPCFKNALACNMQRTLFGVQIQGDNLGGLPFWDEDNGAMGGCEIYSPDSNGGSLSNLYILDQITVNDGWGRELFYYSPSPHQNYVIWSAGSNGRTFAPWIARESLSAEASRCVSYWTKDDIVSQSN